MIVRKTSLEIPFEGTGWTLRVTSDGKDVVLGLHWGDPPKILPTHATVESVDEFKDALVYLFDDTDKTFLP